MTDNLRSISEQIIKQTPQRSLLAHDSLWAEQSFVDFSSNDYLGLAKRSSVKKSASLAIKKFGCGSGGSRLMSPLSRRYTEIERKIANFFGYEEALLFGSGFLANIGILGALLKPEDIVLFDKNCHASIVDGVVNSGAKWKRFAHNSLEHLEKIASSRDAKAKGNVFILTESVFSMDGDMPDLVSIKAIANKHNAILIVDEAHAVGVFGQGRGLSFQLNIRPDIIIAPFGKAFGSYGAACLCDAKVKQALIQSSRPFIFSTALPPASIFATSASIDALVAEPNLGNRLLALAQFFHHNVIKRLSRRDRAFKIECDENNRVTISCKSKPELRAEIPPCRTQIATIVFKSERMAEKVADEIRKSDLFVKAIKHPTVPKGAERIRISICLSHSKKALVKLSKVVESAIKTILLSESQSQPEEEKIFPNQLKPIKRDLQ